MTKHWQIFHAYVGALLFSIASVVVPAAECPLPAESDSPECPEPPGPEVVLLVPRINEHLVHECAYVLMIDDRAFVSGTDLDHWHLRRPAVPPGRYREANYYPLDAIDGLSYEIDDCNQELLITGEPAIFARTLLSDIDPSSISPTPATPGGFLNYDAQWQGQSGDHQVSALIEAGVFNSLGVATGTFVRRDDAIREAQWIRLESTWTSDWPERRESLRLGDSITRGSTWGRPVRLGGVQWGTNFATQPDFITFPMPTLRGEAALPSTVDVYVNNILRQRRDLPPGPFDIPDLPVVTGAGEVSLVVRDLLGRETIITQPYYASPSLLQAGLRDYSFELGFVREDFGLRSNRYGRGLGVATYRTGLTDTLTGELRAELLKEQQTAGIVGTYLWPAWAVFEAGVALSNSEQRGSGALAILGAEHQSRNFSVALRTQLATADYTQLGLLLDRPAPRQITTAHVGLPLGPGSMTLSYVYQDFREHDEITVASAHYNLGVGRLFLSLFAVHTRSSTSDTTIGLTATLPLGERTSASVHHARQRGQDRTIWQAQRNLPIGEGFGFRALAEHGETERIEAGATWQTRIGTYTLEAARTQGETSHRLGATGGVAILGGGAFLTRRIRDSFAVVNVGDYPEVRVYVENQEIGRTDHRGQALVPRMRAYQANLLGIEQADLPIDAEVKILRKKVAPYHRSGVLVEFPVRDIGGALLKILLEDGTPLPAGASVTVLEREEETFPVAHNGLVFVTGLAPRNRIEARWREQSCQIEFDLPPDAGPLPELGPFVCKGVHP